MQALLGIIFHSLGGISSGSWYMPYNWVKKWRWEIYWITGGLFSWLIMPYLAVVLTIPNWQEILHSAQGSVIRNTYIMGLLWGVGGLTYGLAIRYLGMSLGNSVLLGITSVVGSLGLPILRNIPGVAELLPAGLSFSDLFGSTGGRIVLLGIVILVIGIILSGRAGIIKDRDLAGNKEGVNKEFKLATGLIIAVVSGVLSAFFSFGIDTGKEMAEVARTMAVDQNYSFVSETGHGFKYLFENNIIFFVILWGGLTTNLVWSVILILKLPFLRTGRYYLVFAVLFLRDGRNKNWQRCQFLDASYGHNYFNSKLVGLLPERVEKRIEKGFQHDSRWDWNHPFIGNCNWCGQVALPRT